MKEEKKAADFLSWMAWGSIICGIILFTFNVSDFNTKNLPLMVSIGCLIGGVNILLLSAVFRLMTMFKQRVE